MRIMSINNNLNEFNGERLVKSLKVGDVLRGNVVNISEGRLSLKISSEQVLNAAILTDEPIEKGTIIEIIITHMDDEKIYAQIQKSNSNQEAAKNEIFNILKKLGVSTTEFNSEVLKTLIKHRLPINKEIIDYLNFLSKATEPFKKGSIEEVLNLMFSEKDILNTPLHELINLPSLINKNETIDTELLKARFSDRESHKEIKEVLFKEISESYELDETALIKLENLFREAIRAGNAFKKADLETLVFMLSKNIEATPENLFIYSNINMKEKILSGYIENLLKNIKNNDDSEIQYIAARLKDIFLQPEELNKYNMNVKLKELLSLLIQLESLLEAKGENGYEIRDNLMGIRNALDFIKSINNNMNYIHFPIMLNNQQTDVEIFVYERGKRNKKIDISNVNILICLNLDNIGYIESHIDISNKNINITFKSEDRIAAEIINYHKELLKNALELKNYSINISSIENEDGKTNLTSMEDFLNPKETSRYSIDVRI